MSRKRLKSTGRAESGGYFGMPHAVMESPNYRALSAHARMLLNDLGLQYRGANNGDLSTAWRVMQPRGWRSRDTLGRAQVELLHFGLIEKTRQGGLNVPNLFALTWRSIDECHGKLDVAATRVASALWNKPQPPMPKRERKNATPNTTGVSDRHGQRVSATRQACQ
jgi:hypothetical protein